jgi:hypothetical protein
VHISMDIIGHWLDLLNSDGWIPREQILGAEALRWFPLSYEVWPKPVITLMTHLIYDNFLNRAVKFLRSLFCSILPMGTLQLYFLQYVVRYCFIYEPPHVDDMLFVNLPSTKNQSILCN